MSTTEISIPEVETVLARGFRTLRFPRRLEQHYEEDIGPARRKFLIILSVVLTSIYMTSFFRDANLMPDVTVLSAWWHFAFTLPLVAGCLCVLRFSRAAWLRETSVAVVSLVINGGFLLVALKTNSELAAFSHYDVMIGVIVVNLVMRLQFWYAAVTTLVIVTVYCTTVGEIVALPPFAARGAILIMLTAWVVSLISNYSLELQARRAYLMALREKLHNADLARANRELMAEANLDPLTKVANRRFLENYLDALWLRDCVTQESVVVMMVDVDHFKRMNDRYGHQLGDKCLISIAEVLDKEICRIPGLVARYGGEEFAIVLPNADIKEGIRTAERVRRAIESNAVALGETIAGNVTISIGVATGQPSIVQHHAEVMAEADKALYAAKSAGRNRVWPPMLICATSSANVASSSATGT